MKLLAFDTATDACTVALWLDGQVLERFEPGTRHAERLLPLIDELLAEAGLRLSALDAIAFGRGPGSFTGLRIGAGVAQGLAFGVDLPVVPVSSLSALAQGVTGDHVLAAFDARMQQVYWGTYVRNERGLVDLVGAEVVVAPADVPTPEGERWIGAGSGWDAYHEILSSRLGSVVQAWRPGIYPTARHLAALAEHEVRAGKGVAAELALPVYIRDDVAVKQKKR